MSRQKSACIALLTSVKLVGNVNFIEKVMDQKGSNASGIRRYNERLILTMLSKFGAQSQTELAKLTNLSTQAVMRILNELAAQELVFLESKRVDGKGRPSKLYKINPKGAYSLGVMVGRREIKMVLMDIGGRIIAEMNESYLYPEPNTLITMIVQNTEHLVNNLAPELHSKILGLGVAKPWYLGRWSDGQEMPKAIADIWESFDFYTELSKQVQYELSVANDCSAAAAAELIFGKGHKYSDYLYIYIDSFVGGGLVLKGNLEVGARGNAVALASFPVKYSQSPSLSKPNHPFEIMLNRASLMSLIDYLNHKGHEIENLSQLQLEINRETLEFDEWIEDCANALIQVSLSASVLLDLEAIIIDINLSGNLLDILVEKVQTGLQELSERDIYVPTVTKGVLNRNAIVIGGAILPFYAHYIADKSVLFKQ